MKRWMALLILAGTGCDRSQAQFWKDKFVKEVNYHYQTQQIKNAEIAAREMEIENNKVFIGILSDRVTTLEKQLEEAKLKPKESPGDPGPRKPLQAKIIAVEDEIHLVTLSVGEEAGVRIGDEFLILRGEERIGRAVVDRVDRTGSTAKVLDATKEPRVADTVRSADLIKGK